MIKIKGFTTILNFFKEIGHVIIAIVMLIPIVATMGEDDSAIREIYINENAANQYIMQYKETEIAVHRGGSGLAPQNTMMAFENAVKNRENYGIDYIEFDVQLTKDGKLVTIHDLTYDNVSDAVEFFGKENIQVSSLTYEEARQLNMGEKFKFHGEKIYAGLRGEDIPENLKIPLCDDVISYIEENCPEKDMKYLIEVKSMGINGRKATDELYKLIKKYNLEERIIWSTFDPTISSHMERNYPEISRSANALEALQFYFYARMNWDFETANASYEVLHVPYGSSAFDGLINIGSRQVINYAHKNNIAVQFWTIDNPQEVEYLARNGADCIMTDYPDMVCETLNSIEY